MQYRSPFDQAYIPVYNQLAERPYGPSNELDPTIYYPTRILDRVGPSGASGPSGPSSYQSNNCNDPRMNFAYKYQFSDCRRENRDKERKMIENYNNKRRVRENYVYVNGCSLPVNRRYNL